jgi:hypothetical protein
MRRPTLTLQLFYSFAPRAVIFLDRGKVSLNLIRELFGSIGEREATSISRRLRAMRKEK